MAILRLVAHRHNVGYGDITPVTSEGRIVAGVLIFVNIGLVGFASAQLTQKVLRSGAPDGRVLMQRMDDLQRQLDRIEELLHTQNSLADPLPETGDLYR